MKTILITFIILFSVSSFAESKDEKLSVEKIIKMIDQNSISFDPVDLFEEMFPNLKNKEILVHNNNKNMDFNLPTALRRRLRVMLVQSWKDSRPFFKEEMMFYWEKKYGSFVYHIFWEFNKPSPKCVLRRSKLDPKLGVPGKPENSDQFGTVIDKKYCEKLYGIQLN